MCAYRQWMRTTKSIRSGVKREVWNHCLYITLMTIICTSFHCTFYPLYQWINSLLLYFLFQSSTYSTFTSPSQLSTVNYVTVLTCDCGIGICHTSNNLQHKRHDLMWETTIKEGTCFMINHCLLLDFQVIYTWPTRPHYTHTDIVCDTLFCW